MDKESSTGGVLYCSLNGERGRLAAAELVLLLLSDFSSLLLRVCAEEEGVVEVVVWTRGEGEEGKGEGVLMENDLRSAAEGEGEGEGEEKEEEERDDDCMSIEDGVRSVESSLFRFAERELGVEVNGEAKEEEVG